MRDLGIPEEDAVAIENLKRQVSDPEPATETIDIAVIALPRIANFDDFDPLDAEPGVQVRYGSSRQALGNPSRCDELRLFCEGFARFLRLVRSGVYMCPRVI